MIKNFKNFITENNTRILSGKEVADYVKSITPNDEDVPTYFLDIINNHDFKLETISIESLFSDLDFKEYYDNYDEDDTRYNEYDIEDGTIEEEGIFNTIVVVNGEVLDGYNRATELHKRGETMIDAYVNV